MAISDTITAINTGLTNVANAIRAKTGSQSTISFASLPSAINDVYTAGQNDAQPDDIWGDITNNGNRTNYSYAFYGWSGEYIRPKYKVIPSSGNLQFMFAANTSLKEVESAYFDLSQSNMSDTVNTSGNYAIFSGCSNLVTINDIGMKSGYYYLTFANCSSLKTIEILRFNETTLIANAFTGCRNLENITISGTIGQSGLNFALCTKLSKASIESVVNHLSDNATGKSIIFSQTAVNNAFTQAEWNTLTGTKTNWTLSLL